MSLTSDTLVVCAAFVPAHFAVAAKNFWVVMIESRMHDSCATFCINVHIRIIIYVQIQFSQLSISVEQFGVINCRKAQFDLIRLWLEGALREIYFGTWKNMNYRGFNFVLMIIICLHVHYIPHKYKNVAFAGYVCSNRVEDSIPPIKLFVILSQFLYLFVSLCTQHKALTFQSNTEYLIP